MKYLLKLPARPAATHEIGPDLEAVLTTQKPKEPSDRYKDSEFGSLHSSCSGENQAPFGLPQLGED